MRPLARALIICLVCLLTSCVPTPPPPPVAAPPSPPPVKELNAGPYWHSTGTGANFSDALAYYAALKTLTSEELALEHKRLLAEMARTPDNRLPALQSVLLAVLPGQTMVPPDQAIKHLESARQDAALHRQLADLLILLGDQLSSHATVQTQSKQGSQTLRSTKKKLSVQTEDLTTCRQERDILAEALTTCRQEYDAVAEKLQKLQNIERDLIERERKK